MRTDSVLGTIGNTPHVRLSRLFGDRVKVWMKLERANPGGSIKDRIALAMIRDAESKGILKPDSVIIEPTSGNTGIGLAMVSAVKKYKLILVMPESMSIERRRILAAYGAELVLTPKEQGMKGAIAKANELLAETPNSWSPSQFDNPSNPEVHRKTTAREIQLDFLDGIELMVVGVGTGGHATAVGEFLKATFPAMTLYAVEPENSAVIGGGQPGPHRLQGLGAGFVPKNLNTEVLDGTLKVSDADALEWSRRLAKEEGILAGISTGAVLAGLSQVIDKVRDGRNIVVFNYDTGERYLSIEDFFGV